MPRPRSRIRSVAGPSWGGGVSHTPTAVVVTPSSASVVVLATRQLAADVRNASAGSLFGPQFAVEWTTSNSAKATVSATGLVTAVAAGSAVITATLVGSYPAITGTSTITVTAS